MNLFDLLRLKWRLQQPDPELAEQRQVVDDLNRDIKRYELELKLRDMYER